MFFFRDKTIRRGIPSGAHGGKEEMKRATALSVLIGVLVVTPVFAVERLTVKPNLVFASGQPATTNNADSCDVAVMPAATLLLPYFDVDTAAAQGAGTTTLFTITNT